MKIIVVAALIAKLSPYVHDIDFSLYEGCGITKWAYIGGG